MTEPRVLHKYKDSIPPTAVYIGRPSKWGNPYVIGKHGDRRQVVELYTKYLLSNPYLIEQAKKELAGKDLVCYCAPELCHGHILMLVSNEI